MNHANSPFKSKGGLLRLAGALRYSAQGFKAALLHEAAFRQELFAFVLLTPVAIWLGESLAERALLIGALFFVLIVELLNSAIEALADTITLDHHPMIGRAKDLGSAAVMLSIGLATLIWTMVIISHVLPS